MASDSPLHIAVFPWLAAGHLIPFVELSTRIALLGHRVSFLSTPPNLLRLPSPDSLPPLLRLVPLTPAVPAPVTSTSDLTDSTEHLRPLLRRAYDSLSGPLADFLSSAAAPPVDWLLCDYASYWAVPLARSLNVRTAFLSLFGAATLGSLGPPDELIRPRRLAPEDFTAASLQDWTGAFEWLDKRAHGSVVYVAFGSEVRLNREQVYEIARGLELSGLPFIWALRWPSGLAEVLPDGFEDRTADRGIVCQGWVPQVSLLGHPAVGGFMTHCGWSSVTEGLQFGLALILLPMIIDQALIARLLVEKRVGKEVPRNGEDGAFDGIGISETLRLVMVEEGGEGYRARSRELKSVIGNKEVQDSYVTKFVEHLKSNRPA